MRDVASAAGVSEGAVSKVIRNAYGVSPAMRSRVQDAIDELGYRPSIAARSLRGSSFTVGLEIPQLGNDFYTQVMEGAMSALTGSRYQLLLAPRPLDGPKGAAMEALVDRQVDGLIIISAHVPQKRLDELASDVPLVLLGRHDESPKYDTIRNDDAVGVGLALEHLRSRGHRRIAHLTILPSAEDGMEYDSLTVRRATYDRLMRRDGADPQVFFCGASEADAYQAALAILTSDSPPSAIFAGADMLAIGVLRAVGELGLADAVAIVGYDDIAIASHPFISLTTVNQHGFAMGEEAVRLLMERINSGRTEANHPQLHPQLMIRRSTRPLGPVTGASG